MGNSGIDVSELNNQTYNIMSRGIIIGDAQDSLKLEMDELYYVVQLFKPRNLIKV